MKVNGTDRLAPIVCVLNLEGDNFGHERKRFNADVRGANYRGAMMAIRLMPVCRHTLV